MKKTAAALLLILTMTSFGLAGETAVYADVDNAAPEQKEVTYAGPAVKFAPEQSEKEAGQAAMYAAYLAKLLEYQGLIRDYDWQMSDGEFHYPAGSEPRALRPVAITDVWGDEQPELIFVDAPGMNGYKGIAELRIYGWQNGSLQELCNIESWDAAVASGTDYCIFQIQDSKELYAYSYNGDESGYYTWSVFSGDDSLSNDTLADAEVNWSAYEPREDVYTIGGLKADQASYDAYVSYLFSQAERVVLYSAIESRDSFMAEFLDKEMISMSLDDAIAYLTPLAQGETTASEEAAISAGGFTLNDLNGCTLSFLSGVGAWSTDITMGEDGAFTGTYHDSNMGESGEGYDATLYICPFTGRFDNLQQIDATTYTADLAELNYTYTPGETWIEQMDGARVLNVAAEAYGLENCSQVTIYLPGTPIDSISNEALFLMFYEGSTLDGVAIIGSGDFYTSDVPAGLSAFAGNTADPQATSDEGQIFPDSSSRILTEGDLVGLSPAEIQNAINEIYARHGYAFQDADIRAYYDRLNWYMPVDGDMNTVSAGFNETETANVDFLAEHM